MSGEYPTGAEIRKIRTWRFQQPDSFTTFMAYVQSVGQYWPCEEGSLSFGWKRRGRVYYIATGGWSGNEDIIEAMQKNFVFWSVCWQSSRRGGGYVFRLPDPKIYFKRVE
jgi:hypothetical protein